MFTKKEADDAAKMAKEADTHAKEVHAVADSVREHQRGPGRPPKEGPPQKEKNNKKQ
jgi:hypothetical protein